MWSAKWKRRPTAFWNVGIPPGVLYSCHPQKEGQRPVIIPAWSIGPGGAAWSDEGLKAPTMALPDTCPGLIPYVAIRPAAPSLNNRFNSWSPSP